MQLPRNASRKGGAARPRVVQQRDSARVSGLKVAPNLCNQSMQLTRNDVDAQAEFKPGNGTSSIEAFTHILDFGGQARHGCEQLRRICDPCQQTGVQDDRSVAARYRRRSSSVSVRLAS